MNNVKFFRICRDETDPITKKARSGWWHELMVYNLIQLESKDFLWIRASLVVQMVKNLPAMQETQVRSLGQEGPMEKWMTTHSSILAGRIPRTEATGRLQSLGSRLSEYHLHPSELICHIWLLQQGPSWFLILIVHQHILWQLIPGREPGRQANMPWRWAYVGLIICRSGDKYISFLRVGQKQQWPRNQALTETSFLAG